MQLCLDDETCAKLALLGRQLSADDASDEERARNAVQHLISSAMDGMRRPGAWERHWLEQAFLENWLEHMEQVPGCPWPQLRLRKVHSLAVGDIVSVEQPGDDAYNVGEVTELDDGEANVVWEVPPVGCTEPEGFWEDMDILTKHTDRAAAWLVHEAARAEAERNPNGLRVDE